eukprot:g45628.t1
MHGPKPQRKHVADIGILPTVSLQNVTFLCGKERMRLKAVGMTVRAVVCSSCRMWGIRETSSVPGGYTCEKRTQLQLLTDRIRERELELDALRIIR